MTVTFSNPDTMPRRAGYSQVCEVTAGKLVLIAGQVPHDTNDKLVGENDFAAQVEQVFKNLVKINNYCVASVTPEQRTAFQKVRDRYVDTASPPVSTFIFVSRLAQPGWLFEMDAMAVIDA
jgi:enamine deaminase RidA (YjgF/YER057c/UK114 family)